MGRDLDWDQAPCRWPDANPDFWFDDPSITTKGPRTRVSEPARACLDHCPLAVRNACLLIALDAEKDIPANSRYGVFGGASPKQRYQLWARRHPRLAARKAAKAQAIAAGRTAARSSPTARAA